MALKEGQLSEYNNQPLLVLDPESRYCFQFGLKKAKLILQELEAIRTFVEMFDKPAEAPQKPAVKVVKKGEQVPTV